MTRKRYIKLLYALSQKIHTEGRRAKHWGKVLKATQHIKYGTERQPMYKSYAEAWEGLKDLRQQYGM